MNLVDKHLKYFTLYAGIVYAIGFLILSARLASIQIYIRDFFTLDYLKASILFLFINFPVFILSKESKDFKGKKILLHLLSLILCIVWFSLLEGFLFHSIDESKIFYKILTIGVYPVLIYFYSIEFNRIKITSILKDGFKLGTHFLFVLIIITLFSNLIFPQVKFKYGGGAPYKKTLFIKNEVDKIIEIEATVYYENDDWVHLIKNKKVISIPKNKITKEETQLEDNFFMDILK